MSARLRGKRGRRHQLFAERYRCDCRRHEGRNVALQRMALEVNAALADDVHRYQGARPRRTP